MPEFNLDENATRQQLYDIKGKLDAPRIDRKEVSWLVAQVEHRLWREANARAAVERVRATLNDFCHGEQQYTEHERYCVPIMRALDGEATLNDNN